MLPNKNTDEYTRYCITPEGKEYLRRMLEEKNIEEEDSDIEFELNMDEEIDFENLKIFDDDDDEFEPDEDELFDDDFFRINEERNDDAYDFWKETQS
jgi:DNA-binding PadR family transcriptional regulator